MVEGSLISDANCRANLFGAFDGWNIAPGPAESKAKVTIDYTGTCVLRPIFYGVGVWKPEMENSSEG